MAIRRAFRRARAMIVSIAFTREALGDALASQTTRPWTLRTAPSGSATAAAAPIPAVLIWSAENIPMVFGATPRDETAAANGCQYAITVAGSDEWDSFWGAEASA